MTLRSESPGVRGGVFKWLAVLIGLLAAAFLLDIDFGLEPVETQQWGGLTVTLVVSVTGIVASLPLGILLALGRRSEMPVVRLFSVIFIELWRGVPLITVLFMSSVMLPLFLPEGVNFDKLLRALIAVSLFSAAYMAEVVRGGLQAIPKGQYEGAMALGLSYWQMTRMIIMPQALKISIPNIVSNFIGLFKDTTLVSIIGLFDLLGIVQSGLADAKWANPNSGPTGYFAAALIFWMFCFGMSRYSIYTERRLATGHKR
jgi:general L-amino acid transport system permease protein